MPETRQHTSRVSLSSEVWRERILDGMGRNLDQMVAANEVTDFSGDAGRATINAMTEAALATNRINDRIGAFYTTDRVRKMLGGISRQAVSDRVRNDRLLRVTAADGVLLFPAFQFNNGAVVSGLQRLLKVLLSDGTNGWTVTYWLTARIGQLGESSPLDVLASGDADRIAELERIAGEDAAGWRAAT